MIDEEGTGGSVRHGDHVVDLLNSEPVEDVGHEELEPHVLDTGDHLGRLEVSVGRVTSSLSRVVDEVCEEEGSGSVPL